MTKIIAPIDEKNVTSDWIEGVFDNFDFTMGNRQAVGFVNRVPVLVEWSDNYMVWQSIPGGDNCLNELEKRLSEYEDSESSLYSVRRRIGNCILQSFYFRED